MIFACLFFLQANPSPRPGLNSYGEEVLESVEQGGILKLNGTKVVDHLTLNGSLISAGAEIANMEVAGEANLSGCTIRKKSQVTGYLQCRGTHFEDSLEFTGHRGVFSGCTLEQVTVLPVPGVKTKQVIELKQGTIVRGTIRFEGGNGEVHISPTCQIYGKVVGGKIIKTR